MKSFACNVGVLALLVATIGRAAAGLSDSFTYQGQLAQNEVPVTGTCDFQFGLWDAPGSGSPPSGGSQIGTTQTVPSHSMTNGLFTVELGAFAGGAFSGDDRWLQVALRCPAGAGSYTTLSPRQKLTAAPYALYAPSAGTADDVNCSGCISANDLANNAVTASKIAPNAIDASRLAFVPGTMTSVTAGAGLTGGTITGSGTIAANIGTTPGTLAAGDHTHAGTSWALGGNSNTFPEFDFVGTTDNQALELKVNGSRALRLEPATDSPNLLGGYSGNSRDGGMMGVTIGGGGNAVAPNQGRGHYATVGGGLGNQARNSATVSGGYLNNAGADSAVVGGGSANDALAVHATVGGGGLNSNQGVFSTIAGGYGNRITGKFAAIAGGGRTDPNDATTANRVTDDFGAIGGGGNNIAGNNNGDASDAQYATVAGGGNNVASALGATVGGGGGNQATADYATVPGGTLNFAVAPGSFAAGRVSAATHEGSFVWGDGTRVAASQGPFTFNALATGGFRFYFDAVGNHCDLTSNAGWQCMFPSDRNLKEGFAPADGRAVLRQLVRIPIQTWTYKNEGGSVRHIGPTAQDFHAAFAIGEGDTQINTVDANGIALAAIQGLYELLREKDEQISTLEARLQSVEDALRRAMPVAAVAQAE